MFCQAIYKGIEREEWEELYCHYRDRSKATGAKKPARVNKAKRQPRTGDPACKEDVPGRTKTRLELREEHHPTRISLISWQRRSIATWQLNATRPSSQSSRKRETTSPDQFCQMTSTTRLSTLCSYSSKEDVLSLPAQSSPPLLQTRLFGQPHLHTSPKSGEKSLFDRKAFSSAIMCKPNHKAQAFHCFG